MHTAWGYPLDIPIHNRRKIKLKTSTGKREFCRNFWLISCQSSVSSYKHETFKK